MESSSPAAPVSKGMFWAGWVVSAIPVLLMLFSAGMKLTKHPTAIEGFTKYGYSEGVLIPLGVVELACAMLYAIPRTAVFGAILVAAYLGGATNTHVRAGEPYFIPIALGVMAWIGLYLREPRLRALVPFVK